MQVEADPELEFGGGGSLSLHVKSFLALLFAIGDIAVWVGHAPQPPGCRQVQGKKVHP